MSPSSLYAKGGGRWSPPDAARWLSLAAAPTFAIMALATSAFAGGPPDMLCLAGGHASPLSGMAVMYAMMSIFHSAPWLRRIGFPPRDQSARPVQLERPFTASKG